MATKIECHFECTLTECTFNSHDNLRFDEFGDPIGTAYCMAPSEEEVDEEEGYGVPDDCPLFYDVELRRKIPRLER